MPRPQKMRRIYGDFEADYFKPRGKRMSELEETHLEADELEALRLADLEDRYQNDAADLMGVSRQTFGNIIKRAHQKVADALINGKAIALRPHISKERHCTYCGSQWKETEGPGADKLCPDCEEEETK